MSSALIDPRLPRVSFVIPVRDDAQRLRVCLSSIVRNDYPADRLEIVVVDNGSTDDSALVAREAGAIVVSIPRGRVSELRNEGAKAASGEILAFVDADHEIGHHWIRAAAATLTSSTDIAAVGALCDAPADGNWLQHAYDRLRRKPATRCETDWLGSGNLVVRRAVFDRIGGFDVGLESCEDVDLSNRIRSSGFRILNDAALRNVHFGDPSTLTALFFGELWRGRDNLRVTLRGPRTVRHWRSLLVPMADVAAIGAAIIALYFGRVAVALLLCAVVLAFALVRTATMVRSNGRRNRRTPIECFVVALVYDVARALALVVRTRHRTRRIAEGSSHVPANSHS
jgi:glycosyltransferase involved in cell wall biosynthesis